MLRKVSFVASILATLLAVMLLPSIAWAQLSDTAAWAADLANRYRIVPNITYLTANNYEAKLDVYQPRNATQPTPTLIYIHGGGWVGGSKETSALRLTPY